MNISVPAFTLAISLSAFAQNAIVLENQLAGDPPSVWDVSGIGDSTIQGFTTDISVNLGDTVYFKVTSPASFRVEIYRMGYYQGNGARRVASIAQVPAQSQPACLSDVTGLVDCGTWSVSTSWVVPQAAVSGIYFARLVRLDTGGASHVFFVVRNDAGSSSIVFQTSDTTWQAYNFYSRNLYGCNGNYDITCRSYKVSYNRPFYTRQTNTGDAWLFNAEYPMVRWLEANGYDVSYISGVDTDRLDPTGSGSFLRPHRVFLSVGHDEYWSGGQRANVEAARAAGVNLAFFSGNEVFWKTRWESSIDNSRTPYRTLVCYKETMDGKVIDPADPPIWTGTWRDPRFSPPADGGRPENALSGTMSVVNAYRTDSIKVPQDDGRMRFWRNTAVAALPPGGSYTMPAGTLGFEWDIDADNGVRPPGLFHLSTATYAFTGNYVLQDYGSTYGPGTATHHLTLYRDQLSRALVFGAGTVQWSWGLDNHHDSGSYPTDPNMQQATVNLLADMGVQPESLQPPLTAATISADTTPPTSLVNKPTGSVQVGATTVLTGTAADNTGGGVVGGVEVSTDGGGTWHPADGRENWSYSWTPNTAGSYTIVSRAVDDNGNLGTASAAVAVDVIGLVSIDVTPANPTIRARQSQQFMAKGTYSDNSTRDITAAVGWASSNTNVATISSTGLAKAKSAGTTTISAIYNGVVGKTTLTVTKR